MIASFNEQEEECMPMRRVICSIDEQELNIIEKYKLYYKDKYGVNLSRNAIIRMLVCRLDKEINEVIK
ncbi:hypothetical protein B4W97_001375 [Salmonella enterica subsp. enterica serovar Ohio]|uniref:Uncharacterized protein n=1 Tax=Salmonella enterica subsp. enterica serovar Ohio TaxID=117541 RepID=A0A5I1HNC0_SALET|nr:MULTISPECIES: hypothetical protein [Salmonella]EAW2277866.1 hypothetical protein [Salmonella enterica subsp. enterica]ECB6815758.1 hypothetical protein [Salmonella enterica subsp. enterica serovar Cairina]ECM7144336.1 hypothetical protein [Salmonella enterica subsp. enterica serovar Dublin]EDR0644227.1 hypothetical protein [Salmonella enterica subsp. enterica serovar Havana]EDT4551340.1 hypothetical protein [Salmonella enterica subsp. enterica serovar Stanleyville]EDU1478519.1 hypothetical